MGVRAAGIVARGDDTVPGSARFVVSAEAHTGIAVGRDVYRRVERRGQEIHLGREAEVGERLRDRCPARGLGECPYVHAQEAIEVEAQGDALVAVGAGPSEPVAVNGRDLGLPVGEIAVVILAVAVHGIESRSERVEVVVSHVGEHAPLVDPSHRHPEALVAVDGGVREGVAGAPKQDEVALEADPGVRARVHRELAHDRAHIAAAENDVVHDERFGLGAVRQRHIVHVHRGRGRYVKGVGEVLGVDHVRDRVVALGVDRGVRLAVRHPRPVVGAVAESVADRGSRPVGVVAVRPSPPDMDGLRVGAVARNVDHSGP